MQLSIPRHTHTTLRVVWKAFGLKPMVGPVVRGRGSHRVPSSLQLLLLLLYIKQHAVLLAPAAASARFQSEVFEMLIAFFSFFFPPPRLLLRSVLQLHQAAGDESAHPGGRQQQAPHAGETRASLSGSPTPTCLGASDVFAEWSSSRCAALCSAPRLCLSLYNSSAWGRWASAAGRRCDVNGPPR